MHALVGFKISKFLELCIRCAEFGGQYLQACFLIHVPNQRSQKKKDLSFSSKENGMKY